jgi:hypothetical protein
MSITDLFRQPRQSSADVFPRAEPWRPHVVDGDHDCYLANVPRLSEAEMVQHVVERGYTPEELQRIGAELRRIGFDMANGRTE